MRDILVTLIILGAVPFILARAHVGIYIWSWIGYMNPHRLTWGFAYHFPFAAIVAGATLVAILFSRERLRFPWEMTTAVWLAFVLWMTITTFMAQFPELAWPQWEKVIKIQLMVLLTMVLINSRERINTLVWIIVASIGFYGVKGGLFAIATGGHYKVWGPEGSFIYDNNQLALAMIMLLPLMRYLQMQSVNKWVGRGLLAAMLLTALAILASYSRGALIGLAVMGLFLWAKSRKRVMAALVLVLAVPFMWSFMPEQWTDRMGTIEDYDEDRSAMGRLYVWDMAYMVARDHFAGGGFGTFYTRYFHDLYTMEITGDPHAYIATDAHSVYFLVLGDHGFIGLALFLLLMASAFFLGTSIIRRTKDDAELKWARDLAAMIQVSMIGYAVGGAFLGLSYFDLYYHLIALLVVTRAIVVGHGKSVAEPTGAAHLTGSVGEAGPRGGWGR